MLIDLMLMIICNTCTFVFSFTFINNFFQIFSILVSCLTQQCGDYIKLSIVQFMKHFGGVKLAADFEVKEKPTQS